MGDDAIDRAAGPDGAQLNPATGKGDQLNAIARGNAEVAQQVLAQGHLALGCDGEAVFPYRLRPAQYTQPASRKGSLAGIAAGAAGRAAKLPPQAQDSRTTLLVTEMEAEFCCQADKKTNLKLEGKRLVLDANMVIRGCCGRPGQASFWISTAVG